MKLTKGLVISIFLAAVVAVVVGGFVWELSQSSTRLSSARKLIEEGDFLRARNLVKKVLTWSPSNPEANMLLAEAILKDELLEDDHYVELALSHLKKAERSEKFRVDALLHQARIHFLIKIHPFQAEEVLEEVRKIDPENYEANYWLWKIYDISNRSHFAQPYAIKAIENSTDELTDRLLRDWYMSQFFPTSANVELKRRLGFLAENALPDARSEADRYMAMIAQEPTKCQGYAALARWFSLEGDHRSAMKWLQDGIDKCDNEESAPFFLSALVTTFLELGKAEEAISVLNLWPENDRSHEYYRLTGITLQDLRQSPEEAIAAFDKAFIVWPGEADWRGRVRKSNCLKILNQLEAAEAERKHSLAVEELMRDEVHADLRAKLKDVETDACRQAMVEFYEKLNCKFEADAWRKRIGKSAGSTGNNTN